jgi:hypothetical protein
LLLPRDGPPFIFRGEAGDFETTVASRSRPGTFKGLSPEDVTAFYRLFRALCRRLMLKYDYGLNEEEAKAFLQHYGLPTEMIDFSWQSGVAMAFAAAADAGVGRICVMPVGRNARPPRYADLSRHPWAQRAQTQRAVSVAMPHEYQDLKSPRTRARFDLTWVEFQVSAADRVILKERYKRLVSADDDPSSGFLRYHIIEYVEAYGKLSPALTEWILGNIPIAPRCYKVKRFEPPDVIVNNAPPAEFGPYDTQLEKDRTRRYLSTAYPDSSWDRMENWKWPAPGAIIPDPRTFHGEGEQVPG